jgi:hypothetical protein
MNLTVNWRQNKIANGLYTWFFLPLIVCSDIGFSKPEVMEGRDFRNRLTRQQDTYREILAYNSAPGSIAMTSTPKSP